MHGPSVVPLYNLSVYEPAAEPHPVPLDMGEVGPVVEAGPRRGSGRGTALLEVLLCSGYPTQILLVVLLTRMGMSMRTPSGGLTPNFIFTLSLLDAVLVVALACAFIRARGERIGDVLLGRRNLLREALLGVMLVPFVFLLVAIVLVVVLTLLPRLHNVPHNPLEAMVQTRRDALIFSVVVMLAGGVREEIQRGFIIHRFDQHLGGARLGVVVYSLAFGLGHVEQGWDAVLATGLLGAVWGTIYVARRSVVAPMVSHAGFNLLQLIKFVSLR
jgi:membrane protease YdiL (CAAX protease family)